MKSPQKQLLAKQQGAVNSGPASQKRSLKLALRCLAWRWPMNPPAGAYAPCGVHSVTLASAVSGSWRNTCISSALARRRGVEVRIIVGHLLILRDGKALALARLALRCPQRRLLRTCALRPRSKLTTAARTTVLRISGAGCAASRRVVRVRGVALRGWRAGMAGMVSLHGRAWRRCKLRPVGCSGLGCIPGAPASRRSW